MIRPTTRDEPSVDLRPGPPGRLAICALRRQPPPDHGDERGHLGREQVGILRRFTAVATHARSTEYRVPAVGEMLERPLAGRSLGDADVAGPQSLENPAAVQERVGGLEWIGDLLLPRGPRDAPPRGRGRPRARSRSAAGRLSAGSAAVQVRVAAGQPVRSVDRPRRVAPILAPGMAGRLRLACVLLEDVPRVPLHARLSRRSRRGCSSMASAVCSSSGRRTMT